MFSLPAATANTMPSATPRATAAFMEEDAPPPRLMLATAGTPAWWWLITQSTAAMTAEYEAPPLQPNTRAGTSVTFLATPCTVPPIVPATWVPWPLQSLVPRPSFTVVKPLCTRPESWLWVGRMPVSMT